MIPLIMGILVQILMVIANHDAHQWFIMAVYSSKYGMMIIIQTLKKKISVVGTSHPEKKGFYSLAVDLLTSAASEVLYPECCSGMPD